jgi:hypothetical protein
MTHAEPLTRKTFFTPAWRKHLLIGAGTALLIVGFFVIAAGRGNPAWGDYWRIKPLLLSPFLGAITGVCYDVTAPLRRLDGWLGKLFLVLSLLGFFIGQWLGLVLGLAGTMWN